MVDIVVKILVKENIIKPEETTLYRYGLSLLTKKILHVFIMLLFGTILDKFENTVFFLIAYAGIREYAGGYHAKTTTGCYFCTGGVIIFSTLLFYIFQNVNLIELCLILVFCGGIIWVLAPQETPNKPLDTQEMVLYRKKSRKCLIAEGAICLACFFSGAIISGIVCAWIIEVIMLIVGRLKVD